MIEDLIYDVGMHRGKDTEFFLGKGFRVVAIEANLGFVEMVRHRLSGDVDSGRLTILGVAISDRAGLADFWIDTGDGINSSLIEDNLLPWTSRRCIQSQMRDFRHNPQRTRDSVLCTFPENTEPAATGQGVVSADFSTPTGERPSRARRGSPR